MNDILDSLNLNPVSIKKITEKTQYIKTIDNEYILKELTPSEFDIYKHLKYKKVKVLIAYQTIEYNNRIFQLYPFLKDKDDEVSKANKLLLFLNDLKKKTMIEFTTSRMDIFKIKKMILVMNERFNLVELKIREIELSSYKDDTSWIVLSKYHILLDCKKEVYKLTKKISNELKKEKVLCYCILHSYPTLEHFINDRLISYPYSKYGYYVNDLYKAYVDLEHLNFDIKSILDKYLDSSFAKQYFKLMVMYTYISGLETIDFKTYEGINRYIWYTKKISKCIKLFSDYK